MSRFARPAKDLLRAESWRTTKLSAQWIAVHLQRCRKNWQVRQGIPSVAHLQRSDRGIAPELSNHDADRLLAGPIASDQVQRQPAVIAGCSALDVMVPSQGTSTTGSRVLAADHSLTGWTAPWEVQENNTGKARESN